MKDLFAGMDSSDPKKKNLFADMEPKPSKTKGSDLFAGMKKVKAKPQEESILAGAADLVGSLPSDLWVGVKGATIPQALGFPLPSQEEEDIGIGREATQAFGTLVGESPLMGLGGSVGGMSGAFALPAFAGGIVRSIKTPLEKDRSVFAQVLGRGGTVIKDTIKEALLGKLMKFAPTLGKGIYKAGAASLSKVIPYSEKLAATTAGGAVKSLGKSAANVAGEAATLSGGRALMNFKVPTKKEFVKDVVLVGALKATGAVQRSKAVKAVSKAVGIPKLQAKTKDVVKGVLEKTGITEKFNRTLWKKESQKKVKRAYEDFHSEKVKLDSDFSFDLNKEFVNKGGWHKYTKAQRKDAVFVAQGTENPYIKNDTPAACRDRVPKELRKTINEFFKPEMKKLMDQVNKIDVLDKIDPRESVRKNYVPGMHKAQKDFVSEAQKLQHDLSLFNPAAKRKQFKTYKEAKEIGGLEMKYPDLYKIHAEHAKRTNELIAKGHLIEKLIKLQGLSGITPKPIEEKIAESNKALIKEIETKQKERAETKKTIEKAEKVEDKRQEKYEEQRKKFEESNEGERRKEQTAAEIEKRKEELKKYSDKEIVRKEKTLKDFESERTEFKKQVDRLRKDRIKAEKNFKKVRTKLVRDNSAYTRERTPKNLKARQDSRKLYDALNREIKLLGKDISYGEKTDVRFRAKEKALAKDIARLESQRIREATKEVRESARLEKVEKRQEAVKLKAEEKLTAKKKVESEKKTKEKESEFGRKMALKYNAKTLKTEHKIREQKAERARIASGNPLKGKIYVNADDPIGVLEAKRKKWPTLTDKLLRRMSKHGVIKEFPIGEKTYMHPDAFAMLRNVLKVKDRKVTLPGRAYDAVADLYKFGRVAFGAFHYAPLTETFLGFYGTKGIKGLGTGLKKLLFESGYNGYGRQLRGDKELMGEAVSDGLVVDSSVVEHTEGAGRIERAVDWVVDHVPITEKLANIPYASEGVRKLINMQRFLFKEFHPNLKIMLYKDTKDQLTDELLKRGEIPTKEKMREIGRASAALSNDGLGGQNWNLNPIFNDPTYRKWLGRAMGYPDWGTSAAKQAANAMFPGLKGNLSRRYWLSFGINQILFQGLMKFVGHGLLKDKEGDVVWDSARAVRGLVAGDPSRWASIPIMRDSKGRILYVHSCKQALEIEGWADDPIAEAYSKQNPIPQVLFEQLAGYSVGREFNFPVQPSDEKGKRGKPWEGSEAYTSERYVSHIKHLIKNMTPFALPVSTGLSPSKAHKPLVEAYKKNDKKMVTRLIKAMQDNKHPLSDIKRAVTIARKKASQSKR
jgi:hypothetical protein